MSQLLVHGIGQLISFESLALEQRFARIQESDLRPLTNAWLAIEGGKVVALGEGEVPPSYAKFPKLNAEGRLVTPGLVDAHTHPIFGGDRSHEFAAKLGGKTYQAIAAEGGGIKFSIRRTRETSTEELLAETLKRLSIFLRHGVTTVEAKSGYGQNAEEELRCLRVLAEARKQTPQTLSITCLGLHDIPSEFSSVTEFVRHMTEELLPVVAREGLADWVDAFVEKGYFEVSDATPYFRKARELGLATRVHADEFADSEAASAAAVWKAASADHTQKASDAGLKAMAEAGTVAVLLPGTSFFSKIAYAQASRYRDQNCPIAVATDLNPGSCTLSNLNFVATLAALYCGLNPTEALAAVTWVAARALRLEKQKGALAPGFDADFVWHAHDSVGRWIADFGQTAPRGVYISGKSV